MSILSIMMILYPEMKTSPIILLKLDRAERELNPEALYIQNRGPNLSFPQPFSYLPAHVGVETIVTLCLKLRALQAVQNDTLIISIKKVLKELVLPLKHYQKSALEI